MNVIIVNDYCRIEGGAANVAISTAVALSKIDGINVVFVGAVKPICNQLKESNISEIYSFCDNDNLHNKNKYRGTLNGIYNREFGSFFRKVLSKYSNTDTIVHIHTWTKACSSVVFSISSTLGFKIVLTLHDYFAACPNGGFYNYKRKEICRLAPLSAKCIFSNCDSRNYPFKLYRCLRQLVQNRNIDKNDLNYIAISHFSQKILAPYIGSKVYFLTDPVEFKREEERVHAEQNNTYLFIGRLSEEKGIRLFCQAISELKLQGTVIGDGPLFSELKSMYPTINFVGWLEHSQMDTYIKKSRLLVFTSCLYETLGLTPLECQAYGVPAIIPDECSATDYITDDVNGLYFKTGDIDSLINCLMKSEKEDSLIKSLSENAFNNFDAEKWSMKTHIDGLMGIYNKILYIDKERNED